MLSNAHATAIVEQIHQRIQTSNVVNLAQLPSEVDPTGQRGLERILRETTCDLEPSVQERLRAEYLGEGPLTILLDDLEITEIIINGPRAIGFERHGQMHTWGDTFLSEITHRNFLVRLCREADLQITIEHPFANGKWRDFRVHLTGAPCVEGGVVVCLRRLAKHTWSFGRLAESAWANPSTISLLTEWIADKKNILVVGGTGSGKTSIVNAYLQCLPQTERVITIEDTPELVSPNALSTSLLTRKDPQGILRDIDQGELVRQSLRMRPDRLVLGEVRGGEAKDLLMAWSTGHSGSWATLHAETARQALLRLEMLVQLGAPQWNLFAVRKLIHLSLDAIAVVKRLDCGQRALVAIEKLTSLEDIGILTEPVFERSSAQSTRP